MGWSAGWARWSRPAAAEQLAKNQKRILCFYMAGGLSQLESWDPKPKTDTGGPFRAIPTSVPGVHISELLPNVAKQMHHLMIVRGVNTKEDDHGKGGYMMTTGRRQTPAADYPTLGAVTAKALAPVIARSPGTSASRRAAAAGDQTTRLISARAMPASCSATATRRPIAPAMARFRSRPTSSRNFAAPPGGRAILVALPHGGSPMPTRIATSRPRRLMGERDLFDVSKEPAQDLERYGTYDLGRHCLLARRLLSGGATFVQVANANYDTHNENFDFHLEQLGEFDRSFAAVWLPIWPIAACSTAR